MRQDGGGEWSLNGPHEPQIRKLRASANWASRRTVPRLYLPENLIPRELLILRGAPWTSASVYSVLPIEARGWRARGHH